MFEKTKAIVAYTFGRESDADREVLGLNPKGSVENGFPEWEGVNLDGYSQLEDDFSLLSDDEESLEGYCDRLNAEQANHIGTLNAIGNGYSYSDTQNGSTYWGDLSSDDELFI